MKCPISFRTMYCTASEPTIFAGECLKEECAWWSSEADACAVMVTAGSLAGLVAIGDTMLDKIPHEEQP